jgi:hypothetical protein
MSRRGDTTANWPHRDRQLRPGGDTWLPDRPPKRRGCGILLPDHERPVVFSKVYPASANCSAGGDPFSGWRSAGGTIVGDDPRAAPRADELKAHHGRLMIAGASPQVTRVLQRSGLAAELGDDAAIPADGTMLGALKRRGRARTTVDRRPTRSSPQASPQIVGRHRTMLTGSAPDVDRGAGICPARTGPGPRTDSEEAAKRRWRAVGTDVADHDRMFAALKAAYFSGE